MESSAQPGAKPDAVLSGAIDRLWVRFLPEIGKRVAVLEKAATAVSARKLTAAQREAARAAAHKLAGALGTFGLERGTKLAQELELTFSRESAPIAASGKKLAAHAAELRALIEGRKTAL